MAPLPLVALDTGEVQTEFDVDLQRAEVWPDWAVVQLVRASAIATDGAGSGTHALLATELYRRWYAPAVAEAAPVTAATRRARPDRVLSVVAAAMSETT